MKNSKKKAFTLTELLVVVIVIGILAGVGIPKMRRVLETRKTTEAEEALAAIRTEQEKRCLFGKNYRSDLSKLDATASLSRSKNYTYRNLEGKGAQASSKSAKNTYTLKMLSYKEGEICCEGAGCADLNKSYPACSDMPAAEADECAPELDQEPEPECESGDTEQDTQDCNCEGTQERTRTCINGEWSAWSEWGECSENGESSQPQPCGCHNGGTQIRTRTCNNKKWGKWGDWSPCTTGPCSCENGNNAIDLSTTPPSTSDSYCCASGNKVYPAGSSPADDNLQSPDERACCTINCTANGDTIPLYWNELIDILYDIDENGATCSCASGSGGGQNCSWSATGTGSETVTIDQPDDVDNITRENLDFWGTTIAGQSNCTDGCTAGQKPCHGEGSLSGCTAGSYESDGKPASYTCTVTYAIKECVCE